MTEEAFEAKIFTGEPQESNLVPLPQAPMLQSKTQYHTAVSVQRPRNLDHIVKAVMREAELAGDAFYWSWPVKNKRTGKQEIIDGPSIGLTLCVAREWTNVAVPVDYYETPGEWVFTAHFVDLEKGFTVSRVYRKRKGKSDNLGAWGDRNEDMNFQSAQSRAIRNVIAAGVPRWLLDQAKERAKKAVLDKITPEKLAAAREQSLKVFAKFGIDEARIVAVLGVPVSQWSSEEIMTLKGILNQIKDGQVLADQVFPAIEEEGGSTKEKDRKPRSDKGQSRKAPEPSATAPEVSTPASEQGRGITEDQAAYLRAVPEEFISKIFVSMGIVPNISISELDFETAEKMIAKAKKIS